MASRITERLRLLSSSVRKCATTPAGGLSGTVGDIDELRARGNVSVGRKDAAPRRRIPCPGQRAPEYVQGQSAVPGPRQVCADADHGGPALAAAAATARSHRRRRERAARARRRRRRRRQHSWTARAAAERRESGDDAPHQPRRGSAHLHLRHRAARDRTRRFASFLRTTCPASDSCVRTRPRRPRTSVRDGSDAHRWLGLEEDPYALAAPHAARRSRGPCGWRSSSRRPWVSPHTTRGASASTRGAPSGA